MPTLSIICPTRNRAHLWRRRWLWDSLGAQSSSPNELVIALDHCDDDTIDAIRQSPPLPCRVRVLNVLAPRPEPHPASGIPDNCLFHAATGEILVHVDDDIELPIRFCETIRSLMSCLPAAVIWPETVFVDDHGQEFEPDYRERATAAWRLPTLPGGLVLMPRQHQLHWGAVYVLTSRDIRCAGGHNLAHCQWHNTDTRLGHRLSRLLAGSYFTRNPDLRCMHLGPTWHMQNQYRPDVIRATYGTTGGPKVANGGQAFWSSPWFTNAYTEVFSAP